MNREEAIAVLTEILAKCSIVEQNYVALMPPDADDVLSEGYQLHIRAPIDKDHKSCIEEVTERYGLTLHVEASLAVIYRPRAEKKG